MAWQLTHTVYTHNLLGQSANVRQSCRTVVVQRQQQRLQQQQQWQQHSRVAAASSNGSEGPMSYDDDADSGLSKLRYNKRQSELPKELQGRFTTAMDKRHCCSCAY
jgi:hypothetical protein